MSMGLSALGWSLSIAKPCRPSGRGDYGDGVQCNARREGGKAITLTPATTYGAGLRRECLPWGAWRRHAGIPLWAQRRESGTASGNFCAGKFEKIFEPPTKRTKYKIRWSVQHSHQTEIELVVLLLKTLKSKI